MSEKKLKSFEVSWLFVQEYYTIMNKSPEKLYQFYNKDSYYCNGGEGETSKIFHGQTEINKRIKELEYEDCKVLVSNVDSQVSSEDGIIIQVLGEMSNKGGASHKFAQTFFLAKQPTGYFVLNDIIRFLKEDIENEYEDFETQNDASIQEQYVENQTEVMTEDMAESTDIVVETNMQTEKKNMTEATEASSPSTMREMVEEKVTESKYEMTEAPEMTEENTPESKSQQQQQQQPISAPSTTTTQLQNNNNLKNNTNINNNTTATSSPASSNITTTTSASSTTSGNTNNATNELTENATESLSADNNSSKSLNVKRNNQIKSFATVTASNTNIHSNVPTHIKEISRVENKSSQKPLPNRNVRQDQKNNTVHQYEREVFLKDVIDTISKSKIIEAFSVFGEVKKVEITRRTGILEFSTVEAAKNAILKKHIVVDGHTIIAEEKHKRKPYNNSYNRNRNDYRDSRGGFQNGKNGNFNMNRGKSLRSK